MPANLINLDAVSPKSSESSGKDYPIFKGASDKVSLLVKKDKELKALEGEIDRLKAEVAEVVLPEAVNHVKNGGEELGVSAVGEGGYALVVYKNDFRSGADLKKVEAAIGIPNTESLFRQRFVLSVKGDKLREKFGTDKEGTAKTQKFIGELVALFKKHDVASALESKQDFVPHGVKELFETLTVPQVKSLNAVFKVPSSVTVKR